MNKKLVKGVWKMSGNIQIQKEYKIPDNKVSSVKSFLKEASLNDDQYNEKLEGITKSILRLHQTDIEEFLDKVVEEGKKYLDTKSCCVFLLEKSEKGNRGKANVSEGNALRIASGCGDIGVVLKYIRAKYYVPKRNVWSKQDREKRESDSKFIEYIKNRHTWEEHKNLVDKGDLPMGITAYTVKQCSSNAVICSLTFEETEKKIVDEVISHPEWPGLAEQEMREACTSIIEVPLKWGEECWGYA
jgi:hypothetical protein